MKVYIKRIALCFIVLYSCELKPLIIFLHGTSSAGKSSIARELAGMIEEDYEVLCPDIYQGQDPFVLAVRNSYFKHKYVIVDAIMFNSMKTATLIADLDICFVLVHCPIKDLVGHIHMRNQSGVTQEKRTLYVVLGQLFYTYQLEKNKKNSLDVLTWNDFVKICDDIKDKNESNMAKSLFKDKFLVNGMIQYKPVYTYDLMVNTGMLSSKKCAQQIYNHINSNNKFTAFKQSYQKYKNL